MIGYLLDMFVNLLPIFGYLILKACVWNYYFSDSFLVLLCFAVEVSIFPNLSWNIFINVCANPNDSFLEQSFCSCGYLSFCSFLQVFHHIDHLTFIWVHFWCICFHVPILNIAFLLHLLNTAWDSPSCRFRLQYLSSTRQIHLAPRFYP